MRFLLFGRQQALSLALTFILGAPISILAEFTPNVDACWDVGFVDYLTSAQDCKRRCDLLPNCKSFGYNMNRGDRRCHLCTSILPRAPVDCPPKETCSLWGLADENVSPTSIRDNAISIASGICDKKTDPVTALSASNDLNAIIHNIVKGEYDKDEEFQNTHPAALKSAVAILESENDDCFSTTTGPYPHHGAACTHGGVLFLQLRALLIVEDGNSNRAFPITQRDAVRKTIFEKHKVLIADNGWFTDKSLEATEYFFDSLPDVLMSDGVTWNAPFAVMSARDTYTCDDNTSAGGLLGFTNRGFNVFQTQLYQSLEQGFPYDTPDIPKAADLLMTVVRHETGHQFDRFMKRDKRLVDMFNQLKGVSKKDNDWLRSGVGNDYFQRAPQEIIASQIGNQYLHSTSAQLRLAAHRLYPDKTPTSSPTGVKPLPPTASPTNSPTRSPTKSPTSPPTKSPTHFPTPSPTKSPTASPTKLPTRFPTASPTDTAVLEFDNRGCKYQSKNLGTSFSNPQQCAAAARDDASCSGNQIMWSPYSYSWGCRCCQPQCDISDESFFEYNNNWALYKYKEAPTCDVTLDYQSRGCKYQSKNLGTSFSNPQQCAAAARDDAGCSGNQIMWSPYSYSWGCRCCQPQCDISDESFFEYNNNWALYKYKEASPCNRRSLLGANKYLTTPVNKISIDDNVKGVTMNADTAIVPVLKMLRRSNESPSFPEQQQQKHRSLVNYDMETPSMANHGCDYQLTSINYSQLYTFFCISKLDLVTTTVG